MALAVVEFQRLLTGLTNRLGEDVARLVGRLDRLDQRELLTFITDAYPDLMDPYLTAASDATVTWYDDQPARNTAFTAEPIDLLPVDRLAASGRWAMLQRDPVTALQGTATRAVFTTSRDTIVHNTQREHVRWARHASSTACGFCRLLATRGAVYRSEANARRAHDHCHCLAVPDRDGKFESPAYVEQWQRDYAQARRDGAKTPSQIATAMDKAPSGRRHEGDSPPATQSGTGGGGRIPPGRFTPKGMDVPDDYPPTNDGRRVPFTPREQPRPSLADRERILNKHRFGTSDPSKSKFPAGWSDDDIMASIDLTQVNPDTVLIRGDKITFDRLIDGVLVRVHVRTDGTAPLFWSAYPPTR